MTICHKYYIYFLFGIDFDNQTIYMIKFNLGEQNNECKTLI